MRQESRHGDEETNKETVVLEVRNDCLLARVLAVGGEGLDVGWKVKEELRMAWYLCLSSWITHGTILR